MQAVTITQITPEELESLIEKAIEKALLKAIGSKIEIVADLSVKGSELLAITKKVKTRRK